MADGLLHFIFSDSYSLLFFITAFILIFVSSVSWNNFERLSVTQHLFQHYANHSRVYELVKHILYSAILMLGFFFIVEYQWLKGSRIFPLVDSFVVKYVLVVMTLLVSFGSIFRVIERSIKNTKIKAFFFVTNYLFAITAGMLTALLVLVVILINFFSAPLLANQSFFSFLYANKNIAYSSFFSVLLLTRVAITPYLMFRWLYLFVIFLSFSYIYIQTT